MSAHDDPTRSYGHITPIPKVKETESSPILAFLCILFWIPLGAALYGWILSVFWRWFVLPVFPQMPELSIMQAVGLSLTVQLITGAYSKSNTGKSDTSNVIASSIVTAILILGFGALLHLLMPL